MAQKRAQQVGAEQTGCRVDWDVLTVCGAIGMHRAQGGLTRSAYMRGLSASMSYCFLGAVVVGVEPTLLADSSLGRGRANGGAC